MKHMNFPESNMPLGAGDGNENTLPMRVMVCEHPGYKKGTQFIAGKFELEPDEIEVMKDRILKAMSQAGNGMKTPEEMASLIANNLGTFWITSMHSWCPLILSVHHPFELGYKKLILKRPQDN